MNRRSRSSGSAQSQSTESARSWGLSRLWAQHAVSHRKQMYLELPDTTSAADTLSARSRRYSQPCCCIHLVTSWVLTTATHFLRSCHTRTWRHCSGPLMRPRNLFAIWSREPVTSALIELHWLPIEARVQYNLCLLAHSRLHIELIAVSLWTLFSPYCSTIGQ